MYWPFKQTVPLPLIHLLKTSKWEKMFFTVCSLPLVEDLKNVQILPSNATACILLKNVKLSHHVQVLSVSYWIPFALWKPSVFFVIPLQVVRLMIFNVFILQQEIVASYLFLNSSWTLHLMWHFGFQLYEVFYG